VKGVAGILVLIVFVAGVAVNGSRAQTVAATSQAFRLCQAGWNLPQVCRPLVAPESLALDGDVRDYGDYGGDDGGDGGDENHWWDLAVRVAVAVAQAVADWWASHGFRTAETSRVDWTLFDPVE